MDYIILTKIIVLVSHLTLLSMEGNDEPPPYFSKQKSLSNLCGVHTINNLLGYEACTQNDLDAICKTLSNDIINPHKHIFGGDYDANILLIALKNIGYQSKWLDVRHYEEVIVEHNVPNQRRIGYILNRQLKPSGLKKFFGLSSRHWTAVKYHQGSYYHLDSQAQSTQNSKIASMESFLSQELNNGSHIFEVTQAINLT